MIIKSSLSFFLKYFLGTFVSVFGIVWLMLEPLGGLDYIIAIRNQKFVFYVILTITSVFISTLIYLIKRYDTQLGQLAKTEDLKEEAGEDRSTFDYLQLLKSAKSEVDLLGLSLAPFSTEQYINALYDLVGRDVRVKILMSNPLSPNLAQRHSSLYTVNQDVRIASATTLSTLIKLKRSIGSPKRDFLTIGVMNILPHYGLFRVDSTMLWNPYFAKRTGLGSPYFVVKEGSLWAKFLTQDFDVLLNEYSFPIDEQISLEDLRDFLREDQLIYDTYADEPTMNRIRKFFV